MISNFGWADEILTGELVFGVARIFASFNDTFVHVTDLRCVPTIPTDRFPKHGDISVAYYYENTFFYKG